MERHIRPRKNQSQFASIAPAFLFTLRREGPASDEEQFANSTNRPRNEVAPASLPASDEEEFANFTKRPRIHQSVSSDLRALSVPALIPKGWCRRRGSNPHGLAATGF